MIASEEVEKVEKWLEQNNEIEIAILFGSYAKGSQTQKSDLDLTIQLASGSTISAKQKLAFIEQLAKLVLVTIDLVDLQRTGQPLLSQIMKYGKQLKGGQTQYAELAIKNINTTEDFLPYIKRMMRERRMRCLADG